MKSVKTPHKMAIIRIFAWCDTIGGTAVMTAIFDGDKSEVKKRKFIHVGTFQVQ